MLEFVSGSEKGGIHKGDVFNNPFRLGAVNDDRINYTSAAVVEPFTGDGSTTAFTLTWTPANKPTKVTVGGTEKVETTDWTFANGVVTFTSAPADKAEIKIAYTYDNVVIPQNDIPTVSARVSEIALEAKARRVQIYYSNMAA